MASKTTVSKKNSLEPGKNYKITNKIIQSNHSAVSFSKLTKLKGLISFKKILSNYESTVRSMPSTELSAAVITFIC